jgi:hypothetical protein
VVSGCSLTPTASRLLACFGEFDLDRVLGGPGSLHTQRNAGLGLSRDFTFPLGEGGQRAADLLTELRDWSIGSLALGHPFGPNPGGFPGW